MTFYSNYYMALSLSLSLSLSLVISEISEIFNVEEYRDIEIPVKGQSRLLKWFHSIDWVWFPKFLLVFCS